MAKELYDLSISELAPLIQSKKISPVKLTEHFLSRIEALQPKLNSFITVMTQEGREAARAAEREILAGHYRGPLHGIPISIKDLFATRGVRTTAGSKILSNWVPDFDATPVAKLRAAGAIPKHTVRTSTITSNRSGGVAVSGASDERNGELRPIRWIGTSLRDLRSFPRAVSVRIFLIFGQVWPACIGKSRFFPY